MANNPLFRTKPLSLLLEEMAGENRLRRVLGPVQLTALGVGAIIGTGIFVLTGVAAHDTTGPALMLSFVVSGLACVFAALCYAEFASMVPVAGSAYTYAYATLGELFAWIIGWDLVLEYAVGSATVAHGWSHYFQDFISSSACPLPARLDQRPVRLRPRASGHLVVDGHRSSTCRPSSSRSLVTVVLVNGIKESAAFNATMVVVKLAVVLFVIVVGAVLRQPGELAPLRALRDRAASASSARPFRADGRRRRAARHARRSGGHLLRLHRLRLGLDPRRGGRRTRRATCRSASSPR